MANCSRRNFLRTTGMIGAGAAAGIPVRALADETSEMSIVRASAPADTDEALSAQVREMTRKTIEAIGGMSSFVSSGEHVWVKPNIGWDRSPEQAANTNPDVVAALVELCFEAGASKVSVGDYTCHEARRTYHRSGIMAAAQQAGADVYFVEERKFRRMALNGEALSEWEVYTDMYEADKLINVPIVKHHGLSLVTLGMKNLMGCVGGRRNQMHQSIDASIVDLAAFFKPQLIVIDAIRVLTANGPVGGNLDDVERKDVLAAGTDQVALDAFAAEVLNHQPSDIGHIALASERGLGVLDYKLLNPVEIAV